MCSDRENHKLKSSKSPVGPRRKCGDAGGADTEGPTRRGPLKTARTSRDVSAKPIEEEETYRVQDAAFTFID